MSSLTRRTALAGGAAAAVSVGLAACGKDADDDATKKAIETPDDNVITDTSNPEIVKQTTDITFLSGRPPTTADDWDDVACVKFAEKTTNLHINFGLIPSDGVGEKRNLQLASGDYPGVFYRTAVGAGDIVKYANQGTFLALDNLIEKYMPNFVKVMEKNEGVKDAITFPDGKIYTLPQVYDKSFAAMRHPKKLWVRKDWLDDFGMDVPSTLDEFEAYLKEATSTKAGAVGLSNNGVGSLVEALLGTFEVGNNGPDVGSIDLDPESGKIRHYPTTDGYRDLLAYLNRLYSRGLIIKDLFSVDAHHVDSLGADGRVAAVTDHAPVGFFGQEVGEKYVPVPPLKREDNDKVPTWNVIRPEVPSIGNFVMTDKCDHPIEVARWMDFWYGDEGATAFFLGVEGESYEEKDGGLELKPEILKDKTIDEALEPYALYLGGGYPGYGTDKWVRSIETSDQAVEAVNMLTEHDISDVWSAFTFTEDEADFLSTSGNDISKYMDEGRAAFVTGERSLEEWDKYVKTFDEVGLDEYIKIHQTAFERRSK
jgi:putative aldouronate transport system substrate-binding protein